MKHVKTEYADVAQLAEQLICNQQVNGSSPFIGLLWLLKVIIKYADVAQLAEQLICNQQVIGSSPIIGFTIYICMLYEWADSRVAKGDRL